MRENAQSVGSAEGIRKWLKTVKMAFIRAEGESRHISILYVVHS